MILTGLEAIGFSKYKFKQTTIVIALTVHCIACGTEGSSLKRSGIAGHHGRMLMYDKVTHKNLIDSSLLFRNIKENLLFL